MHYDLKDSKERTPMENIILLSYVLYLNYLLKSHKELGLLSSTLQKARLKTGFCSLCIRTNGRRSNHCIVVSRSVASGTRTPARERSRSHSLYLSPTTLQYATDRSQETVTCSWCNKMLLLSTASCGGTRLATQEAYCTVHLKAVSLNALRLQ